MVAFRQLINRNNRPKGESLTETVEFLHEKLQKMVQLTWEVAA